MNEKTANAPATAPGASGALFMLMMAFGLFFENRTLPLFPCIACFILAGVIKKGGM